MEVYITFSGTGTAGADDSITIENVSMIGVDSNITAAFNVPFYRAGRDYGNELQLCQRYFQIASNGLTGQVWSSVQAMLGGQFIVTMRGPPAGSWSSAPTIVAPGRATYAASSTTILNYNAAANGFYLEMNNFAGMTANDEVYWYSGGVLQNDAEL
jgi:hypothetical protein